MNDFQRGYILAYFKDHQQDYSFYALANNLGISVSVIDDLISELIEENQLAYNSDIMAIQRKCHILFQNFAPTVEYCHRDLQQVPPLPILYA